MSQIDYKNGNNAENTVAELLSTNWSEIVFELTYQDDKFKEMSQGKQAFVILYLHSKEEGSPKKKTTFG